MQYRVALLLSLSLAGGAASAAEYWLPEGSEVLGAPQTVAAVHEDTYYKLARRYNVGFVALRNANPGVDALLPGEGTGLVIPTQFVLPRAPQRGIIVNIAELRLYYFPNEPAVDGRRRVYSYPISIGKMDWATPLGRTTVTGKTKNPSWYPPQSIRDEHAARNDPLPAVVPPGPDNPLGEHAMRLNLPGGYLIHGTNQPSGIGMRVTHGCIRMFPEDIEELFGMVPVGTTVNIVNQPFKLGWGADGVLYLEAHPLHEERDVVVEWSATDLTRAYVAATGERQAEVDWALAERVMQAARGLPQIVSGPGGVDTAELAQAFPGE